MCVCGGGADADADADYHNNSIIMSKWQIGTQNTITVLKKIIYKSNFIVF